MSGVKVAVITAGGSGMGAGAARRLAADGFKVAILSSSGKGEALAAELGGIGVTGSNQSNDDLKRLVDRAVGTWGRIDVLVNSAGHGPRAQILEISDEDWHKGMDTYFMNVVRPARLVTPLMQAQKSGSIINISTAWALEPSSMFPISAVFRAGLASFTKLFADTYAADRFDPHSTSACRASSPSVDGREVVCEANRSEGPRHHGPSSDPRTACVLRGEPL